MNFGQNLYNWFLSNAQSLVLLAIVVIGLYLGFKREFSKLIGFLVVSLVAVGLVFNADGVKDILLELFNKIIGAFAVFVGSVHRIIHQSGSVGGCAEDCKQQEDEQECQKHPANHFSCHFPRQPLFC